VFTRVWILDAESREVVWSGRDADDISEEESLLYISAHPVFKPGNYEVYYSSFPTYWKRHKRSSWWDKWKQRFFDSEKKEDLFNQYQKVWHEFQISVRGSGRAFQKSDIDILRRGFNQTVVVSLTDVGDSDIVRQGFRVKQPLDLRIYSIGEALKDGTYDYGWISNIDTRELVWKLSWQESEPAGGAFKNRKVKKRIHLPEGRYEACYVTDNLHSGYGWNSAPPFDPDFWGLTIGVAEQNQKKNIELIDLNTPDDNVFMKLTGLGDNDFKSLGFTCKKDVDLRIYAIGEGSGGRMYDYCWIVDSMNRDKVWEMVFQNSKHAGGSIKNRMFNEVVAFKQGNYMIYCVTDENHSTQDWNAAPPYAPENWGLSILTVDGKAASRDVTIYSEENWNEDVSPKRFSLISSKRITRSLSAT